MGIFDLQRLATFTPAVVSSIQKVSSIIFKQWRFSNVTIQHNFASAFTITSAKISILCLFRRLFYVGTSWSWSSNTLAKRSPNRNANLGLVVSLGCAAYDQHAIRLRPTCIPHAILTTGVYASEKILWFAGSRSPVVLPDGDGHIRPHRRLQIPWVSWRLLDEATAVVIYSDGL